MKHYIVLPVLLHVAHVKYQLSSVSQMLCEPLSKKNNEKMRPSIFHFVQMMVRIK